MLLTFVPNFSEMELYQIPIIVLVGALSGFLNTVAGGGSLISMPILIFMGLPGIMANATNRVAILFQNIFAVGGFHSKGLKLPFPYILYLCLVSALGGWIGAQLALLLPNNLFNRVLAVVMVVVVLATLYKQGQRKKEQQEEKLSPKRQGIGLILFFLLGIYGGFLQAGIGFMVIALMTSLHQFNLIKTNYIKVFAAILYTGIAVAVFAWQGKIDWTLGLTLAAGQGLGGWFASRWSVDKGEKWIKRILVISVIGMAIKLWFFQTG